MVTGASEVIGDPDEDDDEKHVMKASVLYLAMNI